MTKVIESFTSDYNCKLELVKSDNFYYIKVTTDKNVSRSRLFTNEVTCIERYNELKNLLK